MIKNLVFDMGNVLIDYEARRVLDCLGGSEEDKSEVYNRLFDSYLWVHEDLGILSHEEMLEKLLPNLSRDSARKLCRAALEHWPEYNISRKPEMEALLPRLRDKGYRLYVLSNASASCREALPLYFRDAESLFEGMLFSAEVQCIKPQSFIYEKFFARFGLDPSECFFIDDLKENIEAGERLGMRGYVFDGDAKKLEDFIDGLGDPKRSPEEKKN